MPTAPPRHSRLFFLLVPGLLSCSAEIISEPYQSFEVRLVGPDVNNPLTTKDNEPFAKTQQFLVRLSMYEDAEGTVPYGTTAGSPQTTVEKTFAAVAGQKVLDMGSIRLPTLPAATHSIFVKAEILGQVLPSGNLVARGRCPVVELKKGSGKVSCAAFFGVLEMWAPLKSLGTARHSFAAAALPDGRILVAGGLPYTASIPPGPNDHPLESVEIWDPASCSTDTGECGQWTLLPNVLVPPRYDLTATVTEKGWVVFAGGRAVDRRPSAAVDYFDPKTGTVRAAAASDVLNAARTLHGAALLREEQVVVAGGRASDSPPAPPAQEFAGEVVVADKVSMRAEAPSMTGLRERPCVVQSRRGLVLACGGSPDAAAGLDCFKFNGTSAFQNDGRLLVARPNGVRCAAPGDGSVIVVGGAAPVSGTNPDAAGRLVEVWKESQGTTSRFATMTAGLTAHAVAAVKGKIVVSGGYKVPAGGATPADFSYDAWEIDLLNDAGSLSLKPMSSRGCGSSSCGAMMYKHAGHELVTRFDDSVVAIGGRKSPIATDPVPGVEILFVR